MVATKVTDQLLKGPMYLCDNSLIAGELWDYLYENHLYEESANPFGDTYFISVDYGDVTKRFMGRCTINGNVQLTPIA